MASGYLYDLLVINPIFDRGPLVLSALFSASNEAVSAAVTLVFKKRTTGLGQHLITILSF
jgi:hypothetical protein